MKTTMNAIHMIKRVLVAGLIAVTIGLSLAPSASASTSGNARMSSVAPVQPVAGEGGQETHG
jgi:hypothetical protein